MKEATTDGFKHELGFWGWFVESPRFLINWVRPKQNPEIRANHPDVAKCFDDFSADWQEDHPIMILDVGSGVLPWIKGILGTKASIIACDPLAEEYAKIFDYALHGQEAPVKAFAESLSFGDNSFDIVHCSNALDHTQNPYKAILEMERVCRPGGMILIQGFENEAVHENWQGLHQWNIALGFSAPEGSVMKIEGKEPENYVLHRPESVIYANTRTIQTGPHTERNWFVFCYKNTKR